MLQSLEDNLNLRAFKILKGLKLVGKSLISNRKQCSLKVTSPHKILTNYKGENSNLRVEKPGHRLPQVIRIPVPRRRPDQHHVPAALMH